MQVLHPLLYKYFITLQDEYQFSRFSTQGFQ